MNVIDARGLSCPQPVILLKKELDKQPTAAEIIVDNATAKENTTRFATNAGYAVAVEEAPGEFHLTFTKD